MLQSVCCARAVTISLLLRCACPPSHTAAMSSGAVDGAAGGAAGANRRRLDSEQYAAPPFEVADCLILLEVSSSLISLLGSSIPLHTGLNDGVCAALGTSLAEVLPFSAQEAARLLLPLADAAKGAGTGSLGSSLYFLAPAHPALRVLTVSDAAAAWVIADFLCLDESKLLVDDLVQRYSENPAAEADWAAAMAVAGCPAADTLWVLATAGYAALRAQLDAAAPAPPAFGVPPSAAQTGARVAWQKGLNLASLRAIAAMPGVEVVGGLVAPCLIAALRRPLYHDQDVLEAAFHALRALKRGALYVDGYVAALRCLSSNGAVVKEICDTFDELAQFGDKVALRSAGVVGELGAILRRTPERPAMLSCVAALASLAGYDSFRHFADSAVVDACAAALAVYDVNIADDASMVDSIVGLLRMFLVYRGRDANSLTGTSRAIPTLLALLQSGRTTVRTTHRFFFLLECIGGR